jgi:hypothetical protein
VFLSIVNVSAEMSFWTDTLISNSSQTINYHGFYKFEDTSVDGIGRHIPIEIYLSYQVQALPFPSGVDYCNFTILHLKNRYDSLGNFQNISRETQNYFFTTGALNYSTIIIEAYDRDSIIYDMVCHYEGLDNFTNYAYREMNTPIGSVTTFFPSYYCKECSDYTLEELSQETIKNEAMIEDEINIYDNIQKIVVQNYKLWLITNWISKFGLLFASIILIFAGVYYIYEFIKDLAK